MKLSHRLCVAVGVAIAATLCAWGSWQAAWWHLSSVSLLRVADLVDSQERQQMDLDDKVMRRDNSPEVIAEWTKLHTGIMERFASQHEKLRDAVAVSDRKFACGLSSLSAGVVLAVVISASVHGFTSRARAS